MILSGYSSRNGKAIFSIHAFLTLSCKFSSIKHFDSTIHGLTTVLVDLLVSVLPKVIMMPVSRLKTIVYTIRINMFIEKVEIICNSVCLRGILPLRLTISKQCHRVIAIQ